MVNQIQYLGIKITDKKDCFKLHKSEIITKANKLANQLPSILAKCCNRLLIGKTFWKSTAIPAILYGTDVIDFNKTEINTLQKIDNKVHRLILRAPKHAPVSVLRGDIGAKAVESRIQKTKMTFINY